MNKRAVIAILLAAGASAPAAQAATPHALQHAERIALQRFPLERLKRCNGGTPTIGWSKLQNLNALSWWKPDQNTCGIAFNRSMRMTSAQRCTVLVHEFGHLAGLDHKRSGLMKSVTLSRHYIYPACR